MKCLDQRIGEQHQRHVLGGQQLVVEIARERADVHRAHRDPGGHERNPADEARGREQRPDQRQCGGQEGVGIEQGKPQCQRIANLRHQGAAGMAAGALVQFLHVGRKFAEQKIGAMKLRQQPDDFLLRRLVFAEHLRDAGPDFAHRTPSIHQAQHEVRGRRQPVKVTGLVILEQIPDRAAEPLAVDFGMRPQPRFQVDDPVPGGAVKTAGHWRRLNRTSARASAGPSRGTIASRSRPGGAGRRRSWRRHACPDATTTPRRLTVPRRGRCCARHGPWTPG